VSNLLQPNNVWLIDTPGAGIINSQKIKVSSVYWNGPAANATFVIQNQFGKILIEATFTAGQQPTWFPNDWWDGLIVPTLSSGVLVITLE
jgi:hypothetical protein